MYAVGDCSCRRCCSKAMQTDNTKGDKDCDWCLGSHGKGLREDGDVDSSTIP